MENFLDFISPKKTNDENIRSQIEIWRESAVNTLLIVISSVFTPAIIVWLLRFNSLKDVFKVGWVYFIVYFLTLTITIIKKIDYRIRAFGLIILTFFTALQAMRLGGLAGDGRIYLIVLPVLSLLLIGAKAGATASVLSAITYIIFGSFASQTSSINNLIITTNPSDLGTWIQEGIVLFACMIAVVALQWKFNQFLETIALRNADLNVQNKKLVDDLEMRVSERTSELESANEILKIRKENLHIATAEAERANNTKSEFISRMSHELRAPMNLILGFAQLLEMDKEEPLSPTQQNYIKHVLEEGDHLLKLIDEVLDIGQIESGEMNIDIQQVEIKPILDKLIDLVQPLASQHQVEIEIKNIDKDQLYIYADSLRLHRVLLNLILNAIKYNKIDGKVIISTKSIDKNSIRIEIIDTGVGIDEKKLNMLFQPFIRLELGNENIEGAGLGLSLSKNLIELMNGTIGVESEIGKGSIFWIELPISTKATPSMKEITTKAEVINPPKCEILYIEDFQKNIDFLQQAFKEYPQVKLTGALNGKSGLNLAKKQPDLILLDLNLPDMNGFEVFKLLQADKSTNKIPVIILSADATPTKIKFMKNAGVIDYITKPINVKDFLGSIKNWLS